MTMHTPALNAPRSRDLGQTPLDLLLKRAARRIRLLTAVRLVSLTVCVLAPLCLLVVGLSKLRVFATPHWSVFAGVLGAGVVAAIVVALVRRLPVLSVAKLTERRADLKERFSSAVEFRAQGVADDAPFYAEQFGDAQTHAAGLDLRKLYPLRLPRTFWGGLLATVALFLAFYLPTLPAFWTPQQRKDADDVKKQGIVLTKLAEDIKKDADKQNLDEAKKAAAEAKKLGEAMRRNQLDKKQALVQMQKMTKKLEEAQRKMAQKLPPKSMEQAHQQFKKALEQRQKALAQARKEAPQDALRKQTEAGKQVEKAMQNMEKAMAKQNAQEMQNAMQQMAQQLQSGQMNADERKQMQNAMQDLAKSMENTSMNEIAQQMQQMAQQMSQNMDAKQMHNLAQMMQQMGQKMGSHQLGKMLQMDSDALKKMMNALAQCKSGMSGMKGSLPGLTPEQMAEMAKQAQQGNGSGSIPGKPGGNKAGRGSVPDSMKKYLAKVAKTAPNTKASGQRSKPSDDLTIITKGDPDPTNASTPYYQTYQSSKKAAESTLNKENIPAAYKEQVRDYFNSIRP
jgi:chemotaxis protein histidine kinase CheA